MDYAIIPSYTGMKAITSLFDQTVISGSPSFRHSCFGNTGCLRLYELLQYFELTYGDVYNSVFKMLITNY